MRRKSAKVEHHLPIIEDSLDGDLIDYDTSSRTYDLASPASSNEVDVKEALRSSICLKSKLHKISSINNNFDMNTLNDDVIPKPTKKTEGSSSPNKKEKKSKKSEDVETAAMRRERNRLAAQRCRQRRRDRIDKLEKICDRLQNEGDKLQTEITDLQSEMNHLQKILNNHKCMARIKRENYVY